MTKEEDGLRVSKWIPAQAGLALALVSTSCVMLLSGNVSANPIALPRQPFDTTFRLDDPMSSIAWLFFVNLLVNLTCYAGIMLAMAKRMLDWGSLLNTSGIRFLGALVCVVVVVTTTGALVDFYLVAQPRYIEGIVNQFHEDISGTYRVLVFDPVTWTIALVLIMESVMLASMLVLKMAAKPSAVVAGGMGAINLVFWLLIGHFGQDVVFITLISGILLSPVLVGLLVRWYAEGIRKSGVSSAKQSPLEDDLGRTT